MLDRHGVLRQSHHGNLNFVISCSNEESNFFGFIFCSESRKRKVEQSDSDGDDEFFDRTGEVERKRHEKESVEQTTQALSYDELVMANRGIVNLFEFNIFNLITDFKVNQERELLQKLAETEAKIDKYQQLERQRKDREAAEDDLDDFMSKMSRDKFDKTDIRRLRVFAFYYRHPNTHLNTI